MCLLIQTNLKCGLNMTKVGKTGAVARRDGRAQIMAPDWSVLYLESRLMTFEWQFNSDC